MLLVTKKEGDSFCSKNFKLLSTNSQNGHLLGHVVLGLLQSCNSKYRHAESFECLKQNFNK